MKKTVKILFCALLVLILAYVGSSYYVGRQALKFHNQFIEQLNSSKALKATVVAYKKGLFSSQALTKLTLVDAPKRSAISFEVVDTIYHGPFVFLRDPHFQGGIRPVMAVIRTRLAPEAGLKKAFEKVPELSSAELLTVLGIEGGVNSYLDVPSFHHTFTDKKGETTDVKWGGLTGKINVGKKAGEAFGSCDCPLLLVSGKEGQVRMEGMKGRFDSHAGIQGMGVGSSVFSIGTIEAIEKGQSIFSLVSLELKAQSKVEADRINGSLGVNFDKLNTGKLELGPFSIALEARKLDPAVLARFQKLAAVLQREELNNDKAAKSQMEGLLAKMGAQLLAGRPEFEIKQLELRTSKGDLSGKASLGFDGKGKNLSQNPLLLLASVDASAQLSVSQALFYFLAQNELRKDDASGSDQAQTDAQQLAARLLAAKYMVSDSGAFKSSAAFKNGALTINGNRLGLSKLH
ncbi:MAG: YdgA family protein [Syntrophobacteraceae bacterium]